MKEQINDRGYRFYPSLPENTRPGHLVDFMKGRSKRIGMEYLTYSDIADVYYVNVVREGTTGARIKEFIDAGMLYVFTNTN
ncbi:MAG: hypothetical protein KAR19_03625 [Bacteroidales bacterium]|nr:hypothetical protein [Bacteroidales bacterium]